MLEPSSHTQHYAQQSEVRETKVETVWERYHRVMAVLRARPCNSPEDIARLKEEYNRELLESAEVCVK